MSSGGDGDRHRERLGALPSRCYKDLIYRIFVEHNLYRRVLHLP
ncbi:hypothetical protein RDI58_017943 [Solanum bulbocastanum]|uniref:Uncharacterized protein n=1 Tax=Solanum bulbocastanum TaxID=147425 RepID=A0AAN8T9P7_SOLBU